MKFNYLLMALTCLFMQAPCFASPFTLMQFNIEEGGTLISLEQIISIINASHPDAVCILEAAGNLPLLAEKLGWSYYDTRLQILSRLPLIDPPEGKGIYTFLEISPGYVIALSNVHLPAELYGPTLLQEGTCPLTAVEHIEKALRLAHLEKHLKVLPALAAQGIPTFLAGDFNAPSHLDWTQDAAQNDSAQNRCPLCQVPGIFEWPVSKALEEAGFRDSYREVHPNPVTSPGFTWWADRPQVSGWNPQMSDPHDRIDFIYVAGPAKTLSSEQIGSCRSTSEFAPWPSDHCALVSTFDIIAAKAPTLISVNKRILKAGESLSITSHSTPDHPHSIAVVPRESQWAAITTKPVENKEQSTATFSTHDWKAQPYEAHLLSPNGTILSRIPFMIQSLHDQPTISITKDVYSYKEPIIVSWKHGLGSRGDWLGIVPEGTEPKNHVMWEYIQAELEGSYAFDETRLLDWPLAPGNYTIGYFIDDTYQLTDQKNFTVIEEPISRQHSTEQ